MRRYSILVVDIVTVPICGKVTTNFGQSYHEFGAESLITNFGQSHYHV